MPKGAREGALALVIAGAVVLAFLAFGDSTVLRGLETASLDLRFRLRGPEPPESAVACRPSWERRRPARWPPESPP